MLLSSEKYLEYMLRKQQTTTQVNPQATHDLVILQVYS